jgi:hypothetical protein
MFLRTKANLLNSFRNYPTSNAMNILRDVMLHDILVSQNSRYRFIWKMSPVLEGRMFSESITESLPAPWNAHTEQLE